MTRRITTLNIKCLFDTFTLDAETGLLYWRARGNARWDARYAGEQAFTATSARGYKVGKVLGYPTQAHTIVFAMTHGRWPDGDVDHKNGDRADNRPDNLRECTRSQNMQNRGSTRSGTSRFKGVSWCRQTGKWRASIKVHGKVRQLGRFTNEIDAAKSYDRACADVHGEFAKLNFCKVPA